MRRRLDKRKRRRNAILLTLIAVVVVAILIGFYLIQATQNPLEKVIGEQVPLSLLSTLSTLANSPSAPAEQTFLAQLKPFNGQQFASGGKPIVLYLGAEYCPYCAAQRWPLILALMRFGNFTNLHFTTSSSRDIYPDTPTFTFKDSAYHSDYVVFQSYEYQDRIGNALQALPSNYSALLSQVGGGIPLLDFANKYLISGSLISPGLFSGKNWTQITTEIGTGTTLGYHVKGAANVFASAICKVTGGIPSSVCGQGSISPLQSPPMLSFMTGIPMSIARMWPTVQYVQSAWMRKTSTLPR